LLFRGRQIDEGRIDEHGVRNGDILEVIYRLGYQPWPHPQRVNLPLAPPPPPLPPLLGPAIDRQRLARLGNPQGFGKRRKSRRRKSRRRKSRKSRKSRSRKKLKTKKIKRRLKNR
jgi:hypothetical protein